MVKRSRNESDPGVLILTGPSGSGKGSVAFELARRLGGEIVSMDSMKIYREMDIGTAKPPPARRREVPHHLIDRLSPDEHFSVGDYLPLLEATLEEIEARGAQPIVCGGTALYLKALLDGFSPGPGADWRVRTRLLEEARASGPEAMHARLAAVDAAAAGKIRPQDLRRVVRALEIFETTGRPVSAGWNWVEGAAARRPWCIFGLDWPRETLYARTDRRVERMVEHGLFEEAQRLRERRPPLSRSAAQCIGYKEIFEGLEAGVSRSAIVEQIQRSTRRLVKRQMTWFRKMPITWLPVTEPLEPPAAADEILRRRAAPR